MVIRKVIFNPFIVCVGLLMVFFSFYKKPIEKKSTSTNVIHTNLHEGDILFQISQSGQGKAIQLATHSSFTHCGVLFIDNNQWFVYEAVQPVKKTPLAEWIKQGEKKYYAAKRLKNNALLTKETIAAMKILYKNYHGKNYDLYFEWTDDKLYCSELVWKLYKHAVGVELAKTRKLRDFDLTNPIVQLKLKERYGQTIPLDEKVIAPSDLYDSPLLESVTTP